MNRIAIVYQEKRGPWGGGNQFLKGLKNELRSMGRLAKSLASADAVVVNSHHVPGSFIGRLQSLAPSRVPIVIHRVDGPLTFTRSSQSGLALDEYIFSFNRRFANATVFQSQWSLKQSKALGLRWVEPVRVISNAPDPKYFFPRQSPRRDSLVRVVASSWSMNPKKGFDYYSYLDLHLDPDKFHFSFVGRSPIDFEKASKIVPLGSAELGAFLRTQDVYVTASAEDPCSNSLIEAVHCGLEPVVLRSGGHPELVPHKDRQFVSPDEMLSIIMALSTDSLSFEKRRKLPDIKEIASSYCALADDLIHSRKAR